MKKITIVIALAALVMNASAQYVQEVHQMGGEGKEKGNGITIDGYGSTFCTGYFSGVAQFDESTTLTAVGKRDAFVAKHSTSGKLEWVKQLSSTKFVNTNAIVSDEYGNTYITGTFGGDFTLEVDYANETLKATKEENNAFVLKLSGDGKALWLKQLGGATAIVYPSAITLTNDGKLYVVGHFRGKVNFTTEELSTSGGEEDFSDGFLAQITTDGEVKWAKQMVSNFDVFVNAISTNSKNEIVVGGIFNDEIKLGENSLSANANTDVFVVKYNNEGTVIWAKPFGGVSDDKVNALAIDKSDNILIGGTFSDLKMIDEELQNAGIFKLNGEGKDDGFVAQLSTVGEVIWSKEIGGSSNENINGIVVDKNENIYVLGYSEGEFKLNDLVFTTKGSRDMFVIKMDAKGNAGWINQTNGSLYPAQITTGKYGGAIIAGHFKGELTMGNKEKLTSKGSSDIFIIHLSNEQ